jgi:hypothetical protein
MYEMLTVFSILHGAGHSADSFSYFLNNTIFLLNQPLLLHFEYKVLESHELFNLIIITRLG